MPDFIRELLHGNFLGFQVKGPNEIILAFSLICAFLGTFFLAFILWFKRDFSLMLEELRNIRKLLEAVHGYQEEKRQKESPRGVKNAGNTANMTNNDDEEPPSFIWKKED